MDLQVIIVGAVVFVVSAVIIYLISAFTMKEKTFEEVIAEQKRRQEEEREKAKLDKKLDKEAKKPHKKKGKTKEKASSPPGSPSPAQSVPEPAAKEEDVTDHKMVNIEIDPVIIEPIEAKQVSPKTSVKSKKEKPVKPILHNKDEKTPVVEGKTIEMMHTIKTPKDDLELKLAREKKPKDKKPKQDISEAKQTKGDKRQPEPVVVEEMVVKNVSKVQSAVPPQSQESPKAVQKFGVGAGDAGNVKLMSSLKSASLNETEVQAMIDVLLNKQGGKSASQSSADWNKKSQKGDPVALLRKQLEEKERSLQEEQQMAMAANTRLKEMNQEKSRSQAMEKSYKDKIDYQAQEIQALHNRMHQTHEQHMVETSQLRARIQQLEGQAGDKNQLKRLTEENKMLMDTLTKTKNESIPKTEVSSLKQKVGIMETELTNIAIKLNASENSKKTMEQKLAKYEADIKSMEKNQQSESVVEKRLEEVNKELRKSESKNANLSRDLQAAKKEVESTHSELVNLKTTLQQLEATLKSSDHASREMEEKVKEAERIKVDMEGNLKNLQMKVQETEKLSNEVKSLRQEKSVLSDELKVVKEKQLELSAPASNGDVHTDSDSSNKISITEHEKILSDKDSEISRLVSEIEKKKTEISSIQAEIETQKKKNNELREKNWKAMDALEKSEKSVSESVKSALKDARDDQVASQKELEKFDQSVLQRLFPQVKLSNITVHKDWMSKFEKEAASEISALRAKPAPVAATDNSDKYTSQIKSLEQEVDRLKGEVLAVEQARGELQSNVTDLQSSVTESEENVNKLTSQVAQYRSVLAETENKLTQLENSVESEEKKWQERLQNSELELEQAKTEMNNLREELNVLKSKGSQEMKVKVADLEIQLKESQIQCSQLQTQVTESESTISSLQNQLLEVKSTSANLTNVQSDLEDLRRQLEAEKKRNKELALNVVKLNGIIKTGHDALTQEQQLVEKLKKELESRTTGSVPNDSKGDTEKS